MCVREHSAGGGRCQRNDRRANGTNGTNGWSVNGLPAAQRINGSRAAIDWAKQALSGVQGVADRSEDLSIRIERNLVAGAAAEEVGGAGFVNFEGFGGGGGGEAEGVEHEHGGAEEEAGAGDDEKTG